MFTTPFRHFAFFSLLAAAPLLAPAATDGFSLEAPDLYQTEGGADHLTAGDFNGDGLTDLVCVNNGRNLFYFLYQRAGAERRFELVEEPAESVVKSLAAGDFNGDGRTDLAIGGAQAFVRYQRESGTLGDPRELEEAGTVVIGRDFNADGREDLFLMQQKEDFLLIQGEGGAFERPVRLGHAHQIKGYPVCCDLDGDGLPDLIWRDAKANDLMVVRRQLAPGVFDAEIAYRTGFFSALEGASALGAGGAGFVAVEGKTMALEALRFGPDPNALPGEPLFSRARLAPMLNDAAPGRETYHLSAAPLTKDGRPQLFILAEGQPSLDCVACDADGRLSRVSEASLQGGRKLRITANEEGQPERLWILSREEQTIGAAKIHGGEFDFPQLLDLGSQPLAFDMADLDGSSRADLVFAAAIDKTPRLIVLSDPDPDAIDAARGTMIDLTEINAAVFKDIQIEEIVAADVNRDGRPDLILFPKYESVKILTQKAEGGFELLAGSGGGVSEGLFKDLKPEQLWIGDVTGDGYNELLIARSRFARLIKMNGDGSFEILHQFNGKSAGSQIGAVAAGDVTGDGSSEILLLDRGNEHLVTIYARDNDDYAVLKHVETEPLTGQSLVVADLDGDGRDDLIVAASDRFGVIFPGRADDVPQTVVTRRSEVDDGGYRVVATGDLLSEAPGDEFAALENKEHLLEFFRLGDGNALEPFYKFKVFGGEGAVGFQEPSARNSPEPHEIIIEDLNGDGRSDVAVLAHEKAIVYLRKDKPAAEE